MDFLAGRVLSVCSGGGMLDVGVELALEASRVVCRVEHEAYACHILASRVEEGALAPSPIWTNLRTFDGRAWRRAVDSIVGGYPCQPFSQAGKRLGAEDPRHLWPEILRLIDEISPSWCFFENVRGHLTLGFDVVYADLRSRGYRVEAGLFSAEEVGASHRRERLFILAVREGGGFGVVRESSGGKRQPDRGGGTVAESVSRGRSGAESFVGEIGSQARKERCQQAADASGYGSQVAHRDETGRGVQRQAHDGSGKADASGDDSDGRQPAVGDAQDDHGRRGVGGAEEGTRPGELGRRGSPGSGGDVADSSGAGLPQPELEGIRGAPVLGRPGEVRPAAAQFRGPLPIFAPGPGDLRIWGRIVTHGSLDGLAPSTQPGVRLLADGVALVVDESRPQQLRVCGNGVVPLQAAFALGVLAGKMGIDL